MPPGSVLVARNADKSGAFASPSMRHKNPKYLESYAGERGARAAPVKSAGYMPGEIRKTVATANGGHADKGLS